MKAHGRYGMGLTIGAFTLGATAGSVLGLLFAPASGPVTRRRIVMKIRNYGRTTARQLVQAKRQLARQAAEVRRAAVEKLGDTREWLVERARLSANHTNHRRPVHHRVAA